MMSVASKAPGTEFQQTCHGKFLSLMHSVSDAFYPTPRSCLEPASWVRAVGCVFKCLAGSW